MSRYKVWEGGSSHPRGSGYIVASIYQAAEGPSEPPQQTATPSHSPMEFLVDEVRDLRVLGVATEVSTLVQTHRPS